MQEIDFDKLKIPTMNFHLETKYDKGKLIYVFFSSIEGKMITATSLDHVTIKNNPELKDTNKFKVLFEFSDHEKDTYSSYTVYLNREELQERLLDSLPESDTYCIFKKESSSEFVREKNKPAKQVIIDYVENLEFETDVHSIREFLR